MFNDELGKREPIKVAKLQIADTCKNLIRTIPRAPRDENNREEIAEFLGDDSLQSSGYGLYAQFGGPNKKPMEVTVSERIAKAEKVQGRPMDPTSRAIFAQKYEAEERKKYAPVIRRRFRGT